MVLTAAMVGAETTREQTPHLPITAEEIAEDAAKCREAGAAMVHLHVRTVDGKPSQDAELFRAAIRAIRKRTDVLIQVSTGGAVGMGVDERCGGLTLTGADKPDMATLTTGTVNFGKRCSGTRGRWCATSRSASARSASSRSWSASTSG